MKAVRGSSKNKKINSRNSSMENHNFLVHEKGDHVGVVTKAIKSGDTVIGVYIDNGEEISMQANANIPLGHKIALVSLEKDSDVLKYGTKVGITTQKLQKGDYVHTHNIKTARW